MKYYITKADEMVGPLGMEKPKCWGHPINAFSLCPDCERFKPHLASLPKIKHRLPNKVGDIVEEGKDFEWDFDYTKVTGTPSIAVPKERVSRDDWVNARTDDTYKGPTIVIIHK